MASASLATLRMASGVGADASCKSASTFFKTSRAGSRFGKTESVTATSLEAILFPHRLFHVLHHGEDDWALAGNQHVLFETGCLLKVGMTGEGLDGEVHAFFDLGGILERIGARDPHAFVQGEADAVRELLQGNRAVLVVVV